MCPVLNEFAGIVGPFGPNAPVMRDVRNLIPNILIVSCADRQKRAVSLFANLLPGSISGESRRAWAKNSSQRPTLTVRNSFACYIFLCGDPRTVVQVREVRYDERI